MLNKIYKTLSTGSSPRPFHLFRPADGDWGRLSR